ncbi:MAG: GGDEF domain-containing protein [Acidobacteria bacterium]|nr:GGDEF domain-containing protein [Acidobacteriota bacterium]MBK8148170.1 GGDEF domain-containing protein [Acidobacteriota bacterium]MBK8811812.1 GGDEF domain-containing protein [Acidobacteriota bacterium]
MPKVKTNSQTISFLLTGLLALSALTATFLISNSDLAFESKRLIFAAIAISYVALTAGFFLWQRSRDGRRAAASPFEPINESVEGKLFALEEASEFFGASLKSADMFRLVASRINEILPFAACVLFLADDEAKTIVLKYAFGENPEKFANADIEVNRSLAAKAFLSRASQLDSANASDRRVFPRELVSKFGSALAVPLFRNTELFGVIVLYSKTDESYDAGSLTLAEAIAVRAAPLFTSSMAFERSVSNALTDTLTNLPNERGFFLVLENQIAESQRNRDDRPLTVLAVDIRNFEELNAKHGHVIGDSALEFAAGLIKKQLRQMDVLTRSVGDEFLAVLPTAGEAVAEEIKDRVARAFVSCPFEKLSGEKVFLELNFGSATFWRDGETAPDLLRTARLKKDQDKNSVRGKVLWFPKEYVN